jgi:hypothetical protein
LRRKAKPEHLSAREFALCVALEAAQAHLSYCGYGDSWERECAMADKLPEKIEAALKLCESPRSSKPLNR